MQLTDIYRHPVKGVGSERLERVALTAGRAMPNDRIYALTHGKSAYRADCGDWAEPGEFLNPTNLPKLANVALEFDDATHRLRARHPELSPFEGSLRETAGRAGFATWIAPLAEPIRPGPHRVELARDGVYFGDFEEPWVSVHNHASLRELSGHAGMDLDPRRFRANIWVDGFAPWAEWDWVGREIQIGDVRLRVTERAERCLATAANPETGDRDALPVKLLDGNYGHRDFGVYAEIIEGGEIAPGAAVTAPT